MTQQEQDLVRRLAEELTGAAETYEGMANDCLRAWDTAGYTRWRAKMEGLNEGRGILMKVVGELRREAGEIP